VVILDRWPLLIIDLKKITDIRLPVLQSPSTPHLRNSVTGSKDICNVYTVYFMVIINVGGALSSENYLER